MADATSNCFEGFGKSGFRPPDGDPLRPDLKAKIKEMKSRRPGNYSYESGPRGVIFGPPSESRGRPPIIEMFRTRVKKLLWQLPRAFVFTFPIHLDFGPLVGPPRPGLRAELGAARVFEVLGLGANPLTLGTLRFFCFPISGGILESAAQKRQPGIRRI